MRVLSSRPFCPCDGRRVSPRYLSALGRYKTDLTDTMFAGHHQPLKVWVLCLYFMGLNGSNDQIAHELDVDRSDGFDHGVGHSLLLLCDAKVSSSQKSKKFNDLDDYLSNISLGSF